MNVMVPTPRKPRGIQLVRADAGDPVAMLTQINSTFETFQDEVNAELKDLKKGQTDVVRTEKIDRINTDITELTKQLDETVKAVAGLKIGGAGGGDVDPAQAEHAQAFEKFFRKGERAVDADLRDLEVKAGLSTDSDPDGGYFVPTEMSNVIDRVTGTVSALRGAATVMEIEGSTYEKLHNVGGAAAGWVEEKAARPETATPELVKMVFNAMELYANPAITQRMLDDARLDIAAWLADEVSIVFAEQEGAAFINGDGVGKPRGLLGYDKVANDSWAWGQVGFVASGKADGFLAPTASVSPADCLISGYYALKSQLRNGASWIMSDATQETVRKFKDNDGKFIWSPPSDKAELAQILGKPVITDDNMPAIAANAFPIGFGNFKRGYLIVDRFGVRVLRDPFTNKPYIHFYTTKRVGGGIKDFEAIKLLKIAT